MIIVQKIARENDHLRLHIHELLEGEAIVSIGHSTGEMNVGEVSNRRTIPTIVEPWKIEGLERTFELTDFVLGDP